MLTAVLGTFINFVDNHISVCIFPVMRRRTGSQQWCISHASASNAGSQSVRICTPFITNPSSRLGHFLMYNGLGIYSIWPQYRSKWCTSFERGCNRRVICKWISIFLANLHLISYLRRKHASKRRSCFCVEHSKPSTFEVIYDSEIQLKMRNRYRDSCEPELIWQEVLDGILVLAYYSSSLCLVNFNLIWREGALDREGEIMSYF